VVTVPGEHTNIKVTYVDDLETAARIAAQRT
jgi:2-C-methyl-D-erythritol 4-phosphate cytidylyltransferase